MIIETASEAMDSQFLLRWDSTTSVTEMLQNRENAQILELSSQRLHYWLHGPERAPVIVLLHDTGLDRSIFEKQVQFLSQSYRLLTLDLMGHGFSENQTAFNFATAVKDVQALLDHLQIEGATLVGSSLGGYVAQWLAHLQPARFHGLLLMSAPALHGKPSLRKRLGYGTTRLVVSTLPYWLVTRQAVSHLAVRYEAYTYIRDAIRQLSKRDFFTALSVLKEYRIETPAYRPEMPVLLAHGSYNRVGWSQDQLEDWQRIGQTARTVTVPGAAYCLALDNPVFCNKMISDFLYRDVLPEM